MKRLINGNFSNLSFIFAITILLIAGTFSFVNLTTLIDSNTQISQTLLTLTKLEETLTLIVDAETAQRGYVITGDDAYLEPYYKAIDSKTGITQNLNEIQTLIADKPEQQTRLEQLIPLVDERLRVIEQVVHLRKEAGFESAQEVILSGSGKETMDSIRQIIAEMEMVENDLLLYWSNMSSAYLRNTMIAMTSAATLSLLLLLASFYLVTREVQERRFAQNELHQLNQELDKRVKERSDELIEVSQKYVRVLDTMLEGCQIIGFDWRYLYVNDVVANQGHVTKDELLGRTMMEVYPGIDETPLFDTLRNCMKERTPARIENHFIYPDGQSGWFELSIEPVAEGLFILSVDITERKRNEEAMQQQLYRLKSLRAIDLAILGTTDLRLTLRTVLDEAKMRLHVDIVQIELFNQSMMMLETIAVTGNHTEELQSFISRLDDGINGKAALERRTVFVDMIDEDESQDPFLVAIIKEDGCAVYSTPLIVKGNLIGVFNVIFRRPFKASQDWIDFFETLAGQTAMAIDSVKSFEELQRSNLDLALAYDTTIEGWSHALDLRDKETEGHTLRVTQMTLKLARIAGMSSSDLVHVRRGALLHDIGKMGIPDNILLKPDKLTSEEWGIMRMHPTYAYELLLPINYLHPALDIPYCHHEKWDGSGYPRGLHAEQIPLSARLFAVVDVWDALRSDRPYRQAWGEEQVIEHIYSLNNTHFDPKAVEIFMQTVKK
ncbi:MAG: CHASE3 domain-containing protein [Anaerolineales bacterium]|nr:CHASE3 domain-containing protein [Anaerolineales bacterium]MBX3037993.1 CHASE3 domain-containing protein [Anaerolineales bacterium]